MLVVSRLLATILLVTGHLMHSHNSCYITIIKATNKKNIVLEQTTT